LKIELDCFPCIFRQSLEAGRMATDDQELIREIMNEYAQMVPKIADDAMGPELGRRTQEIIKRKTGVDDPYKEYKELHIERAEKLYPEIKEIVEETDDPLFASLAVAGAGNSIDAGVSLDVDVKQKVKAGIDQGFADSNYEVFRDRLAAGASVLIVGDNSGEAVFDRLLLEQLQQVGAEVIYAVREEPILNDVTLKEAKEIGLNEKAELVTTGSRAPGLLLANATSDFRQIFDQAKLVISKGQGNYEGLSEVERPIFFLLQAKCEVIARKLGVKVGEQVFKLIE